MTPIKCLTPLAKKVATDNIINIINARLHLHLDKGNLEDRKHALDLAVALGAEIMKDGSILSEALCNGDA